MKFKFKASVSEWEEGNVGPSLSVRKLRHEVDRLDWRLLYIFMEINYATNYKQTLLMFRNANYDFARVELKNFSH